ncbi:MAG TPA: hydrogenase 3 maturation endopeptidase HyCI [Acidobacteriota bacterium]|nr:hydrogenase 3 maturation endopeptidase HyCI [Acidobacteriota bacterium]
MKTLESLFAGQGPGFVLLGAGNPLRGDDGAGPALIRRLRNRTNATLFECEDVPENYLGDIVKTRPDTIVVVDAVNLGMKPGAAAILDEENLQSVGWSTHHASLRPLIKYLKANTQAEIFVLGIQPKSTELGRKISPEVRRTLKLLERLITAPDPKPAESASR